MCLLLSGSLVVSNTIIFSCGQQKNLLGDGCRQAQTCWESNDLCSHSHVIQCLMLWWGEISLLPHTATQNTHAEFGQAEPEPVKG